MMGTETRGFGSSGRVSHDASKFYDRFSAEGEAHPPRDNGYIPHDRLIVGDAYDMLNEVEPESVALIVTSPPYFAGADYPPDPANLEFAEDFEDYLYRLKRILRKCRRVLEPGGRVAINVANLGRKPYIPLSAQVSMMLQSLGYYLLGEIIWRKAEGASGSCAWGSWMQPSAPSLRDTTERVIVACKGDPSVYRIRVTGPATISRDDFMRDTLDVWEVRPPVGAGCEAPGPVPH